MSALATSSWAHGHAVMPWAVTPVSRRRAELGADRRAVQRVQLLGLDAGDRGRLVLGEARLDRDLGAASVLPRADELRDVLGERLGLERRLAEDHLADRLVDDLLEARHVRALLIRAEVDDALEAGGEQLRVAVVADPDHLLDAGHADTAEAQLHCRSLRLNVDDREAGGAFCGHGFTTKGKAGGAQPRSERRALLINVDRNLSAGSRNLPRLCYDSSFGWAGVVSETPVVGAMSRRELRGCEQ